MTRLLRQRLAPYRWSLAIIFVLLLVQAITNLSLPTINADIITNGVAKGDTHYIVRMGGLMLLLTAVLALATVATVYFGSKTSMSFGRDVRGLLFRKVQDFSLAELNHFGTSSLITRNTNDIYQVQQVVLMLLTVVLAAPFMAIGGIIMALRLNVPLSGVIVAAIVVMAVFLGLTIRRGLPLFRSMQGKIDRVNQVMREVLSGVRVIRAFDRARYEERRFDEANVDLTSVGLRVNRLFALTFPVIMLIMQLTTVVLTWLSADQIAYHGMPIGDLQAFLQYTFLILFSVIMATIMFVMVPRAAAAAERVQAVLDTEPAVMPPEAPVAGTPATGAVEFRDVEFRYPGAEEPVLSRISFTAQPGKMTAIVGGTGSGKSTLINLVPRLYDVTGGAVLVDGVDVRDYEPHDLWARIGLVPQTAFLFSGSVADNLRHGRQDVTEEELWHLLDISQARDFVSEMPETIESQVAQGGASVSGGQRQRLAIARALARKASIYIFDDSFSAVDVMTDAKLRAALHRETAEATTIVV
ncbi:MAG TPA: ABC transporter ATP-binding protein, partial [Thermoleophilia bacterium]|nr:ABC transporter ATP-binding protein [Thermoleophilia bacterium]